MFYLPLLYQYKLIYSQLYTQLYTQPILIYTQLFDNVRLGIKRR